MIEKSCETCGRYNRIRKKCSLKYCFGYKEWRPSIKFLNKIEKVKTLESQLAKANALIIEQIEQINRVEIELKQYKEALKMAVYDILAVKFNGFDEVDLNNAIERYLDKANGRENNEI